MSDDRWERVADLYQAAQDRAPEERSSFVRQAAAGDSGLRREVESLLAQDVKTGAIEELIAAAARSVLADNAGVQPGSSIGPYRIDSLLGVGGMGEVYRARDTKLNRDVAIKILPPAFANDPDRLARFKREAQVLASLNHPNVGGIYGFEDANSIHALVLELVDGPTLAERLQASGSGLPLDEALSIARQIADALEAAHEQGIIHRDLKPANIKVRDDGTVKVLDFGLAKIAEPAGVVQAFRPASPGGPEGPHYASQSPTITTPAMTAAGMILGTAAYMSPEQAKGQPADKRSDIWAFGCLFYEMLTGKRAFDGSDVAETLAAILRADPDFSLVPSALPPIVRTALISCFQKSRSARTGDIAAIKFALQHTSIEAAPRGRRLSLVTMALGTGALVLALVAAAWIIRPRESSLRRPVVRSSILLGEGEQFSGGNAHLVTLSPDGRRLAYVANERLYLRNLDDLTSTAIRGTEGFGNDSTREPFFSPDGQWLGFWKSNQFKKVSISGGSSVTITEAGENRTNVGGAHWEDDDTILYGRRGAVSRVSANGGTPTEVIKTPNGIPRSPRLLPGGRDVLFTFVPDSDPTRADVVVQTIGSDDRHVVVPGGADAVYLDNGLLVYFSDGTVFAAPFDARGFKLTGPPTAILKRVARGPFNPNAVGQFTVSRNGTFVYVPDSAAVGTPREHFVFVDREQAEQPVLAPAKPYLYPRLSPDGTRLVVHVQDDALDLWSLDLLHGNLLRLTTAVGRDLYGTWVDRQHVVYGSGNPPNVWRVNVDGGGAPERISHSDDPQLPGSVLQDGSGVLVTIGAPSDIALVSLKDGTAKTLLHSSKAAFRNPEISPNGHWLAYQTNESGEFQIEVRPYPDVLSNRYPVSTDGGTQPGWSSTGDELFWVAARGGLFSMPVAKGSVWTADTPHRVIDGPYSWAIPDVTGRLWDVTRDGRRFLLMKPERSADAERASMVLVQNALDELVPSKP
jgi:eukaryotic-like serine/threonine-protein kinase